MIDWLLNRISKYFCSKIEGVEFEEPPQIEQARRYLGMNEESVVLHRFLGVNPKHTPWCAAFVNAIEKRCGRTGTKKLLARHYLKYGSPSSSPEFGDIAILKRGKLNCHVGYFISETNNQILVLGGNQNKKVCYKYYSKKNLVGYRRVK